MASQSAAFKFESRYIPNTGQRQSCVGIECKKCADIEWHPAPQPGWGRRIFKKRGWKVGNTTNSHVCPQCLELRRAGRPEAPGHTAEARDPATIRVVMPAAAADAIAQSIAHEPAPETTISQPKTLLAEIVEEGRTSELFHPTVSKSFAEALAPVKAENDRKAIIYKSRGAPTGYSQRSSAGHAARKFLRDTLGISNPHEDTHYRVFSEGGGTYGYTLLGSIADSQRPSVHRKGTALAPGQPCNRSDNCARSARNWLRAMGVASPQPFRDFLVNKVAGGYVYEVVEKSPAIPAQATVTKPLPKALFLGSVDARKAARKALETKDPRFIERAIHQGVDYWIFQGADMFWGFSLEPLDEPRTAPAAPAAPQLDELEQQASQQAIPVATSFDPKPPSALQVEFDPSRIRPHRSSQTPPGKTCTGTVHNVRKAARSWLERMGYVNAIEGVHYRVVRDPGVKYSRNTMSYELLDLPAAKETALSDASTQAVRDLEEQAVLEVAELYKRADPKLDVRQPTRDDNRKILDALDIHYHTDVAKYRDDWSDVKLAAKLDVPWRWVAKVREEYFGPDINEASDVERKVKMQKLDGAMVMIERATSLGNQIIDEIGELESLRSKLQALAKELKL